jgi:hypothetical protein
MKLKDIYTVDDHEAGAEIQVRDGEGNLTPLWIKVKGADSVQYRKQIKIQKNAYREALMKNKQADDEKYIVKALVECVVGWRGTDEKYSKKLCEELLTKAPFVREQIDEFISERQNFTKAKPKK